MGQYLSGRLGRQSIRLNYSAFLQSTHVLSQAAHLVLSQHSLAQHESAFSQHSVHSVQSAHSAAFSVLLLQAHEAAANIAAATAKDINTFFMVTKIKLVKQNTIRQRYCEDF